MSVFCFKVFRRGKGRPICMGFLARPSTQVCGRHLLCSALDNVAACVHARSGRVNAPVVTHSASFFARKLLYLLRLITGGGMGTAPRTHLTQNTHTPPRLSSNSFLLNRFSLTFNNITKLMVHTLKMLYA